MKKSLVLTLLCLALGLLVAACGDDDDSGGEVKPTEVQTGATGKKNVKKVEMQNIQFVPMEVTVKAGNTIQWTNSDNVTHTVTKGTGPGPKFDSKNIAQGETYERNFPDKGTINYVCTIHPNQKGVIVVQ